MNFTFSFKDSSNNDIQSIMIYQTHWSDSHNSWSKPCEANNLKLGENFGYFITSNDEEAIEFVKKLKPLISTRKADYFPANFFLGSFPIKLLSSSPKSIFYEV